MSEKLELLEQWRLAKLELDWIKPVIQKEIELRKKVFDAFYPAPKEGTNVYELPQGWKLKGAYKLDRKVDPATLTTTGEQLREIGVNIDTLIEMKPSLKTATYRELTKEQRQLFDKTLVIKPSTPTIELVPPKIKEVS